jgi:diacylglycerol kinase (ATP)
MNVAGETPFALRESSVVVFVNTVAGGGRARIYLSRIQKVFDAFRVEAHFVMTKSAAELESSARNSILQGHRVLLAMGGDGTFQALANAGFGSDVVLGVLPLGGGNDFAAALGLPSDPVKAAEAVLSGRPRPVDLARAYTNDGRMRLYAGGGGVGLDAEAAHYASGSYRRLPGRFRYIAAALRALAGHVPLKIRIEFPDSDLPPYEARSMLAAVLNSPTYGAGLRLAPDATVGNGSLHVVMIEELSKFGVLRLLPRLIVSGELRTSRVQRWRVGRVRLATDRPCSFHGDGELLGPTPVEIEVVPRALRVLAPVVS